ncbi:hypothetical protein EP7_003231 [Isosphaeraceae bacterium EP7]
MKRANPISASGYRAVGCGLVAVGLGLPVAFLTWPLNLATPPLKDTPAAKPSLVLARAQEPVIQPVVLDDSQMIQVSTRPKAVARFDGRPLPGYEITLVGDDSLGNELNHLWVQIQGPKVVVDRPQSGRTRVSLPQADARLEFLLVVGNAQGLDTAPLSISVSSPQDPAKSVELDLKADAGDDLAELAGEPITPIASLSAFVGKVTDRGIPTAGPGIGDGRDESAAKKVPAANALQPEEATEAIARGVLSTMDGGPASAEGLAAAFDGIAGRMDLYRTYADAYQEISRRIEAAVPADPALRAAWGQRVFAPLTVRLVDRLRTAGVDLTRVEGQSAPLSDAQKEQLAEQFRAMAEGFRAAGPGPGLR